MNDLAHIVKNHATSLRASVDWNGASWSDANWVLSPTASVARTTWAGRFRPVIDFSVSGYAQLNGVCMYGVLREAVDRYEGRPDPEPGERPYWKKHEWTWLIDFVYPVEGELRPWHQPICYGEHTHKYIPGKMFGMSSINFYNIWKGCVLSWDSPDAHERFLHEFDLALEERTAEENLVRIEKQIIAHIR